MKQRILIAGGTGLIGRHLAALLAEQGHEVSLLSRRASPTGAYKTYTWDVWQGRIDDEAVANADVIINLAGEGIADKRWTSERKKAIIESRVKSAELLRDALLRTGGVAGKTYISAAAQGYYGDRGALWLSEDDAAGTQGFLPESCIAWEAAAAKVAATGIRTVVLRIGLVLAKEGGALPQMAMSYRFGVGTYFGSGEQYYSWIHVLDMCRMLQHAVETPHMRGVYNASAPMPVTNATFAAMIGKALNRRVLLLPAPAFALKIALGEMADAVLTSTRMKTGRIEGTGFVYQYADLQAALRNLLT